MIIGLIPPKDPIFKKDEITIEDIAEGMDWDELVNESYWMDCYAGGSKTFKKLVEARCKELRISFDPDWDYDTAWHNIWIITEKGLS